METTNTTETFFKNETNHVKKDEKKIYLAKFITMLVKTGQDIVPYMGKPLSNYDYNKIYKTLEDYENKQTRLKLDKPQEK